MAGHATRDASTTHAWKSRYACCLPSNVGMRVMPDTRAYVGSHVGSDVGSYQIWDQKAKQPGLEVLRTVHAVEIDC